jgi:hypothetical protein
VAERASAPADAGLPLWCSAVRTARIRLGELAEVRNSAVLGWREYWGHLGAVTWPPGAEVEIECLKSILYHFSKYITHGSSKKTLITFDHFFISK